MPQIKEQPTKEPEVDFLVKLELLSNIAEESQVIVHCSYLATEEGDSIRIWPQLICMHWILATKAN